MLVVWHRCCPLDQCSARRRRAPSFSALRGAAPFRPLMPDALSLHSAQLSGAWMPRRRLSPVWRPALEMLGLVEHFFFHSRRVFRRCQNFGLSPRDLASGDGFSSPCSRLEAAAKRSKASREVFELASRRALRLFHFIMAELARWPSWATPIRYATTTPGRGRVRRCRGGARASSPSGPRCRADGARRHPRRRSRRTSSRKRHRPQHRPPVGVGERARCPARFQRSRPCPHPRNERRRRP